MKAPFESLLLIKPSALGDVVQTVGVARAIKSCWPDLRLGWVVSDSFAPLIEPLAGPRDAQKFIDRIHIFPRSKFKGVKGVTRGREIVMQMVFDIRSGGYEATLDLQGLARSALITATAWAERRIGLAEAREGATLLYNDKVPSLPAGAHAIDRYFNALNHIGCDLPDSPDMGLGISDAERESLKGRLSLLKEAKAANQPLVLLVPGARWESKRWPPELFGEFARHLKEQRNACVVLAGSPDEQSICEVVRETAAPQMLHNIAGQTSIRELAALINMADLVVCNDSAAMHMAALDEKPLIALFGPTDPALTGPWRRSECVIRSPNASGAHNQYRHVDDSLMREISVEEVLERSMRELG